MARDLLFPPFRIDGDGGALWRGQDVVALRPKSLAVLRYLAERSGRLVNKADLLLAAWPGVVVSDIAVKVCIRELRRVLGDRYDQPRFIQTVGRTGYRFLPRVQAQSAGRRGYGVSSRVQVDPAPAAGVFVGRESQLGRLAELLDAAAAGRRQVVFVVGEAGIGKTTLLHAFLQQLPQRSRWRVAKGQCLETYGAGEPYLPVLEGLERLCRDRNGERFVSLLRQHSPSWLLQLPGILPAVEYRSLQRRYAGSGPERMLRELLVGLESMTRKGPLLLVIEDLHWSDRATCELIAGLARRPDPARLMLVATLRPPDPGWSEHPVRTLVDDLTMHRQATQIELDRLSRDSVMAFLDARFPGLALPERTGRQVHECTDGSPLFLANLADDLVRKGRIEFDGREWTSRLREEELLREIPRTLAAVAQQRLLELAPADRRILETASVCETAFTAPTVAWALAEDEAVVAERCASLARKKSFIRTAGETQQADGSVIPSYRFTHEFHRLTLHEGVAAARRRSLHQRIAHRLEAVWGPNVGDIAAELAMHFERGGDPAHAATYRQLAARQAFQRHAYAEAIEHGDRALALLRRCQRSAERDRRELDIRMTLAGPLLGTQGFAAPAVKKTYSHALRLSQRVGRDPDLFCAIEGLHSYYAVAGDLATAGALARRMHRMALGSGDRAQLIEAHHVLGNVALRSGRLRAAAAHLREAVRLYGTRPRWEAYAMSGHDPAVCSLSMLAVVTWMLGDADRSLLTAQRAKALANDVGQPFSQALASVQAAWVRLLRREVLETQAEAESALALSSDQGFIYFTAAAMMFRGWALALRKQAAAGLADLDGGGGIFDAIGAQSEKAGFLAVVGEASLAIADFHRARTAIAEGLRVARRTGVRYAEPDLLRLRGELALAQGDRRRAVRDLARAKQEGRRQGNLALVQRAAAALA